jgi:hypothetical protein
MKQLILTLAIFLLFAGCYSTVTEEDGQTVQTNKPWETGEWKKLAENTNGDIIYIDFERIKQEGGYVYWWHLIDLVEPLEGSMSVKAYRQGDCNEFCYKSSNVSFYSEPMGEGDMIETFSEPDEDWTYPSPESGGELELKNVCDYVKIK